MRDILFKIINKKTKEVIGYEYLHETSGEWMHKWILNGKVERGSWRGFCNGVNQDEWVRLQYTGFKDSKGVKIFEGDILKNHAGHTGVIIYDPPAFEIENGMDGRMTLSSFKGKDGSMVRIGNITDNPELLETKG
jgi:uncharacterized phage protein (TIGR01671 family)